ncbi:Unknown protein [Striga hermonthica]|uniref:Protein TILLER ANGLE CONTROL 1 n=1 Tax=Striga hermonthica TaxID=68872 RepID=A0A9N7RRT5_STRHE|nr:Unknown protein [Striga hermonthica]
MKIFNWVHRKLSYKGGGSEENANKIVVRENNIESNNVFDQLLSGGNILTIGTFGYDPLSEPNDENNSFSSFFKDEPEKYEENNEENETASEKEEEEESNEEEVKNPFVFAAFEHDYKGLIMEGVNINNNHNKERCYDYVMMEKTQRITLADLFSAADSHASDKKPTKNNNNDNNNNIVDRSNVIKKAKRTKKHAGDSKLTITEEARPIRKLQKMVRRVLKRKVHPGMSSPSYKVHVKKCEMFDDHASLLPTN